MDKNISVLSFVRQLNELLFIDKIQLMNVYFYAVLAGLVSLSLPLGIQSIISFVMAGTFSTSIVVLILLVITGTFVSGLLQIRQLQIIETLEQKIFVKYAYAYTGILPTLDLEKYRHNNFPEYVNRFFEVVSLQKGLKKILIDVPTAIIQISIGLLLLSFYHPIFIALGLILLAVLFLIFYFTLERGLRLAYHASENKYEIIGWIEEVARTLFTFKLQIHHSVSIKGVDNKLEEYLKNRTNFFNVLMVQMWSMISFKTFVTAALLIIGTYLLVSQQINVGQFIASDIVIISVMNSVEKLMLSLEQIYETLVSNNKLNKILEMESEPTEGFEFNADTIQKLEIAMQNVSYTYDDGYQVLRNFTLSINSGEHVIIKGMSGSGKSTLFKLMLGIYKKYTGQLTYNKIELKNYNIYSIRKNIGVVFGNSDIIDESLYQNIVMDNGKVSLEMVHEMANVTGLAEELLYHKLDYLDQIGIYHLHLSKAIRAKILLTRLLVGGYKVMFIEDAFKFLSEKDVKSILQYAKSNSITIVYTTDKDDNAGLFDKVHSIK